ncbi:hypothetical protein MMSR116_05850 [Methylobacterium mesophilicum SR1.6/6]|uniref:Uncharacterized protein n=1 Tax=Methylobacterium mesophilicum SR1.6/6 TaxID=908290 RepID=A0A6B9FFV3_9HYPH|nr:hypothetical protein [Methylobacterium mesophilicum]QGY01477.1 hypothetical protein MMSR116_05850 [Methylobacterium mesophilicum SR1.6/6]
MPDIPKINVGDGAGPRNIEMRFTMREALLVHQALRDKEKDLRKEAWWLDQRGGQDGATPLKQQAEEHADAADRIFRILDGMMGIER